MTYADILELEKQVERAKGPNIFLCTKCNRKYKSTKTFKNHLCKPK